ncbi:MAG: lipoate--protein ligase family protein [Cenarchaeum sp. SB0664_bin_35]|nr:lipoate--protein ligase family protein [Cenarchaeum sp. SB0664_bin_35]
MAVDECLLYRYGVTGDTVLRIYGWSRPCITIGYFQGVREEVNLDRCEHSQVDVVRRITGGGAVFHDMEVTYSLVTSRFHSDIMESYRSICDMVVLGLGYMGLDALFSPLNDVTVNGRKVCGNAQTRKGGALLQHGTILLDVDVEKMFSLLNVPTTKIRDKAIADVKERVAGIGRTFEQTTDALRRGAQDAFGCGLDNMSLSGNDIAECKRIMATRYSQRSWTHKR